MLSLALFFSLAAADEKIATPGPNPTSPVTALPSVPSPECIQRKMIEGERLTKITPELRVLQPRDLLARLIFVEALNAMRVPVCQGLELQVTDRIGEIILNRLRLNRASGSDPAVVRTVYANRAFSALEEGRGAQEFLCPYAKASPRMREIYERAWKLSAQTDGEGDPRSKLAKATHFHRADVKPNWRGGDRITDGNVKLDKCLPAYAVDPTSITRMPY